MEKGKKDKYLDQFKIGKFIAQLRKEKNMTQEDLAAKFGITSQSVSKWENGINAPDISILLYLSEILGVEVQELLIGKRKALPNNDLSIKKEKKIVKRILNFIKKP